MQIPIFFRNKRNIALLSFVVCLASFAVFTVCRPKPIIPFLLPPIQIPVQIWVLYAGYYENQAIDGNWSHWGPHPLKQELFHFPQLGLYSSHDPSVLKRHCQEMSEAGIDAAIILVNKNDESTMKTLKLLLDIAIPYGLKIGLALDYYFEIKIPDHPSLLKIEGRTVILVQEVKYIDYRSIEKIRKSYYVIGVIRDREHIGFALENGFDGVVTWYPQVEQAWSSTLSNWNIIKKECEDRRLLFVPTVAPGFKVSYSRIERESGKYYDKMWKEAIEQKADVVFINSFNKYDEGTIIEPSVERNGARLNDDTWTNTKDPEFYLTKTKEWSDKLKADL